MENVVEWLKIRVLRCQKSWPDLDKSVAGFDWMFYYKYRSSDVNLERGHNTRV